MEFEQKKQWAVQKLCNFCDITDNEWKVDHQIIMILIRKKPNF